MGMNRRVAHNLLLQIRMINGELGEPHGVFNSNVNFEVAMFVRSNSHSSVLLLLFLDHSDSFGLDDWKWRPCDHLPFDLM